MKKQNCLKIAFVGAINCVSGSCTLLEYTSVKNGKPNYYLVDCGEYQNETNGYNQNKKFIDAWASKIRAVFITHAHNDHIGLLPYLIEKGFSGKIYCTSATQDLTKLILEDAMRINEKNDKTIKEIIKKMNFEAFDKKPGFKFGDTSKPIPIDEDLWLWALRTSHILGSCSFAFSWTINPDIPYKANDISNRKVIHFSGDVGPVDEKSLEKDKNAQSILLKDFNTPYYGEADKYIVVESTYGDRIRDKENLFQRKIEKLINIITKTKAKGGKVIIPAFALNRMQEILVDLFLIKHHIYSAETTEKAEFLRVQLYSPLGKEINKIYIEHLFSNVMNKKGEIKFYYVSPLFFEIFSISNIPDEKKGKAGKEMLNFIFSDLNNEKNPKDSDIILASSGMCDSGKILELLKFLEDDKNTIILTGYQAEGTNGAMLKKLKDGLYSREDLYNIKLNKTDIRLKEIKADIEDMSEFYSGHADQEQLVEYVHGFNNTRKQNTFPTTVFLNHGTKKQREALKIAIEEKNIEGHQVSVCLPESLKWFNLNNEKQENEVEITNASENEKIMLKKDIISCIKKQDMDEQTLKKILDTIK